MLAGHGAGQNDDMERWRKFNKTEGAAYYALADVMRRLEWDIHHTLWRGRGLPPEWTEIAENPGPGPKERLTLRVDRRAVQFFRATGQGWQTRMNDVLTAYVNARIAGIVRGAEQFNLAASAEEQGVGPGRPDWGDTARQEERERAEEDALLAEVDRIMGEEG